MALDNAQFIAELSPTDPPGTDPLNQGDDHIRTVKLAVQQSFPNVGSAVPQTGVQMAQMAIKNEANIFTQLNTFQNFTQFAQGSAAAPALTPSTATDTGIFWNPSLFAVAVGGVERLQITTLGLRAQDGSAANPAWSFLNNTNMGMYRSANNVLAFATAGVQRITLTGTEFQVFVPFRAVPGTDALGAYSFQAAANTGMSRGTGGALNFASAGTRALSLSNVLATTLIPAQHDGFVTFNLAGTRMFAFANFIRKTSTSGIAGVTYEDTGGVGRWLFGMSTTGNSERFFLQRRDSGGAVISNAWEVNLTDGHVVAFNRDMRRQTDTVNSVISWKTAGLVTRHTINFEATGGFNPQSLTFSAFNSSGTFLGNTLRFGPNGELFMEFLPTSNPGGTNRLWKNAGFVAIT